MLDDYNPNDHGEAEDDVTAAITHLFVSRNFLKNHLL